MMVRIQKVYRGRKEQEAGSSNTRLEGTTTSRNTPVVWSRASSRDAIPMSRLSRSMLSTASSRVKSIDVGSWGSVHWSRGSPHAGEPLPTDVRVRDDSPLAPSATDPSCHDVPTGMPPPAIEGVSGADTNLSPSTMTLRDPLAVSPLRLTHTRHWRGPLMARVVPMLRRRCGCARL